MHGITFAHTDPDGVYHGVEVNETTRTVVAEMETSGTYDGGWRVFDFQFPMKSGVRGGLAMLCETQLFAWDGTVETYGQWRINEPRPGETPDLYYTMELCLDLVPGKLPHIPKPLR
jgi:hypothetical protein